jgi:hypothetical protein
MVEDFKRSWIVCEGDEMLEFISGSTDFQLSGTSIRRTKGGQMKPRDQCPTSASNVP